MCVCVYLLINIEAPSTDLYSLYIKQKSIYINLCLLESTPTCAAVTVFISKLHKPEIKRRAYGGNQPQFAL